MPIEQTQIEEQIQLQQRFYNLLQAADQLVKDAKTTAMDLYATRVGIPTTSLVLGTISQSSASIWRTLEEVCALIRDYGLSEELTEDSSSEAVLVSLPDDPKADSGSLQRIVLELDQHLPMLREQKECQVWHKGITDDIRGIYTEGAYHREFRVYPTHTSDKVENLISSLRELIRFLETLAKVESNTEGTI